MRRLLHAALILAVAAVIPASAMAELCGGSEMLCCSPASSELSVSRPGCCSVPCIEAAPERQAPASETRPLRLDAPGAAFAGAPVVAVLAHSLARLEASPASSPPLSRRLASLSILLI